MAGIAGLQNTADASVRHAHTQPSHFKRTRKDTLLPRGRDARYKSGDSGSKGTLVRSDKSANKPASYLEENIVASPVARRNSSPETTQSSTSHSTGTHPVWLPAKKQLQPKVAIPEYSFLEVPEQPSTTTRPGTIPTFALDPAAVYVPQTTQTIAATSTYTIFATVTKTRQEKQAQAITLGPTPTTLLPSELFVTSLLSASTVASTVPSALNAQEQEGSLTTLARTLLMIFGVLGAITLVVAFGIALMVRYSGYGQSQQPSEQEELPPLHLAPYGLDSPDGFRVTIHVSDTSSIIEPSSLTDTEKAIIVNATTPENELDNPMNIYRSSLSDAINAFVAKSRRLTYKISP